MSISPAEVLVISSALLARVLYFTSMLMDSWLLLASYFLDMLLVPRVVLKHLDRNTSA